MAKEVLQKNEQAPKQASGSHVLYDIVGEQGSPDSHEMFRKRGGGGGCVPRKWVLRTYLQQYQWSMDPDPFLFGARYVPCCWTCINSFSCSNECMSCLTACMFCHVMSRGLQQRWRNQVVPFTPSCCKSRARGTQAALTFLPASLLWRFMSARLEEAPLLLSLTSTKDCEKATP